MSHERSYHVRKTVFAYTFEPKIWDNMVIIAYEMCGKAILVCVIGFLVGAANDCIICSKTPFKGLAPIKEVKKSWIISDLILFTVSKNVFNMTNSSDPDETPPSHLGLRYL